MPSDVSIIVPVFNEEDNVLPMAQEVVKAMAGQSRTWELIFVDDASTDGTWRRIREARQSDIRIDGLKHAHNAGQSAAIWTGICATQGPILATLDGDLQNDPADLPRLLAELPRIDFVSGMRTNRRDTWVRRVSSRVARRARRAVLGVDFHDTGCGLRVFKRQALEGVFPFNGMHRFLPVLVHGNGCTTLEVPVHHRPRTAGLSKYGIWNRLGRGVYDLIALAWYQKRRFRTVPFARASEQGGA